MTRTIPPRPVPDQALLLTLLKIVCDQDRGEDPFDWSPPARPPYDFAPGSSARGEEL